MSRLERIVCPWCKHLLFKATLVRNTHIDGLEVKCNGCRSLVKVGIQYNLVKVIDMNGGYEASTTATSGVRSLTTASTM